MVERPNDDSRINEIYKIASARWKATEPADFNKPQIQAPLVSAGFGAKVPPSEPPVGVETLDSPEEREIKDMFDRLQKAFGVVGITEQNARMSQTMDNGIFQFIGITGDFAIHFYPSNPNKQAQAVEIRREYYDEKSRRKIHEDYLLEASGKAARYHRSETGKVWMRQETVRLKKEEGKINNDRKEEKNKALVLDRLRFLTDSIDDSLLNPDNSPQAIHARLKQIHTQLMQHFAKIGLVPEMQTVVYNTFGRRKLSDYFTGTVKDSLTELEARQNPLVEVGRTYKNITGSQLGDKESRIWDLQFDTDSGTKGDRSYNLRADEAKAHGMGIILKGRTTLPGNPDTYFILWENGDATYQHSFGRNPFWGKRWGRVGHAEKFDMPDVRSPHVVIMRFESLLQLLTNPKQPKKEVYWND